MKKLIFSFILTSLITLPVSAQTDQKTIDFLEKVNRYYYCLSREGLRSFTADISVDPSKMYAAIPNSSGKQALIAALTLVKFSVSCSATDTPIVTAILPLPSGNDQFDSSLEKIVQAEKTCVKGAIQGWTESMFKPLNDQETYDKGCHIQKTAEGFSVIANSKDGAVTGYFDSQTKQYAISGTQGTQPLDIKVSYSKTAQGYLLTDDSFKAGAISGVGRYFCKPVQRFNLLKSATYEVTGPKLPGGEIFLEMTFSNYQLDY